MPCTSTCAAGERYSSPTTSEAPRLACRSLATSATHFCALASARAGAAPARRRSRAHRLGEGEDEALDLRRRQLQPVVGQRRDADRRALHRVQPAHRAGVGVHPPPLGEVVGVAHAGRPLAEDVGAERQHHLGLGEVVAGVERPAEGAHRGGAGLVGAGGLPAVPARLRVLLQHGLDLVGQRRRGHRAGEDAQPLAGGEAAQRLADLGRELRSRCRGGRCRGWSASGPDRRASAPRPARSSRSRRGSPGGPGSPRSWSAAPGGSRRARPSRSRRG